MLEIGRIIRKMGSEFSIMKMEINSKEAGLIIKGMGKELIGSLILKIN